MHDGDTRKDPEAEVHQECVYAVGSDLERNLPRGNFVSLWNQGRKNDKLAWLKGTQLEPRRQTWVLSQTKSYVMTKLCTCKLTHSLNHTY